MTTFSIKEHQNAKGFDVSFKTGSATIPDQEGGYIISTGCGSGISTVSFSLKLFSKFSFISKPP